MSISIFMINLRFWMDDCTDSPFAGWLISWIGWICFDLGAKEGCMPGVSLQPSVAPLKGEQPWSRAPRCCLPWFPGFMMFSKFTETLLQSLLDLCYVPSDWFSECWICFQGWLVMVFTHILNEPCWCGCFYFTHLLYKWFINRVGRIISLLGYTLYLFDVIRPMSWILFIQGVLRRLP